MNICLAIESAGHLLSVALLSDEKLLAERKIAQSRGAPALLLPLIQEILHSEKISPSHLNLIAVNVGPGSFTGLRAGIAAAQGIAFGLSCPLVGISAFQALAHSHLRQGGVFPLGILLDSRREEPFAAQIDRNLNFTEPPKFLGKEQVADWRNAQENLLADQPHLATHWYPVVAYDIGLLALKEKFHLPAQPIYLREPEISKPKVKAILKRI